MTKLESNLSAVIEELQNKDVLQDAKDVDLQKQIDVLKQYLVPAGAIVTWSGSIISIPPGWHLCDGTNGTPDLRGRFVIGAGNSYSVGITGGEATHTLTANQMPSHNHSLGAYDYGTPHGILASLGKDLGSYMQPGNTGLTGGDQPHNNMPPYYALAYIMRIA